MDSAPESCPNCYGTGKSHTCGERASCIPCEREDADKELEAKLRVRLLGAAARLRMRAACELNQPRGHTMDAREWASTCLECAAEDIEAEAGGRAPQLSPPQPAVPESFARKWVDDLFESIKHGDADHQAWLRNAMTQYAETHPLYALDSAAPQKRIAELEAALREVIGMWPEHRHGPVKLPPMSVQREVFGRANEALTGEPR